MFSQGFLLLLVVFGSVTSLPQPFKLAKLQVLPGVPISPPAEADEGALNVTGGTAEKTGLTGAVDIPAISTLPNINTKDILAVPEGDLVVNAVTKDKPNGPKLEVADPSETPRLTPLPNVSANYTLPLPKGELPVTAAENKPILPESGPLEIPGLDPLSTVNGRYTLPGPKVELSVTAEAAENKPILPESGVPVLADMYLQLQGLYRHIKRLEAVLQLEGKIQTVGDKMMATSGKEVDFDTSKSICKAVGGWIATPKSEAEKAAVLALVRKYNKCAHLEMTEGPVSDIVNHIKGVYSHWKRGGHSGKEKVNCATVYTNGQWYDNVCNKKCLTVCEI